MSDEPGNTPRDNKGIESTLTREEWSTRRVQFDPSGLAAADAQFRSAVASATARAVESAFNNPESWIHSHWVSWLREEADIMDLDGAGAGALIAREIADALEGHMT